MKNIERLAAYITKHGSKDLMIHTIPGTGNWVVAQKIELNKWSLTICNPMGEAVHNLGTVDDKEHVQLWSEIARMKIENTTSQIIQAKEIKKEAGWRLSRWNGTTTTI